MFPRSGSRRVVPIVLLVFAGFYMVRDPQGAAVAAKGAMNALMTLMDAFAAFFNGLT